jgi:hypothetical protein
MATKSTTLLKPTWELLLLHWDNLRILLQYGVSKHISASPLFKSKKEALDTADRPQAPTLGVDRNIH